MSNLKLNKNEEVSYINEENNAEQERKIFANKKANKALIIAGAVIVGLILLAVAFIYVPIG